MQIILKWTIPVDDQIHEIGAGAVVHVASQFGKDDEVQVWTVEATDGSGREVATIPAKVVGTGQAFNDFGTPVGSVVAAGGHLVWHVIALPKV